MRNEIMGGMSGMVDPEYRVAKKRKVGKKYRGVDSKRQEETRGRGGGRTIQRWIDEIDRVFYAERCWYPTY